ncbi:major facilitator superfamily domain-containing protein [Aspergillus floccosus]
MGDNGTCPVDEKREKLLLRKIDIHLMVPLWVIFVFGFLDRINLGNVSVLGIMPELRMTGTELTIAMQIFFVPYILTDIPSNIILKRFAPSTWISALSFFWGIACMCQGFVKNGSGLIACRFILGLFEGGFVPGCAYLMSMYYKRHDFQKRFSLLWVAGLVAGAFGGLLAFALYHMHGLGGYSGWRWIFIIEGLLSIVFAVPAKFIIADWPEHAKFLSEAEKQLLRERNSRDVGGGAKMDRLDGPAWKRIMSDWKIYVGSLIYLGITVSGYATALFIPSIVKSLGYSGADSQVHSIPVWAVAAVVTVIVSYLTDRLQHRYGFIMFGVIFASIGYIILLCQGPHPGGLSVHVRYMAVFFVTTGCYIVQPVAIVWMANNLSGHYKRAIGLAIQIGFGNLGGIVASNIFNSDAAPRYTVGYSVSLAMIVLCGIMSTVFAAGLVIENKKRDQGKRDDRFELDENIRNNLGDDDPTFRFSL